MKRIAIFCDGTWNDPKQNETTNVHKLYVMSHLQDKEGEQVSIYQAGVGTGRGDSWWQRRRDQFTGGAFGWGLTRNIKEAYKDLAEVYEPGDKIFLFGFSRGAYTARSLGGLIRCCGIPTKDNMDRIDDAIARYRDRSPKTHPATDESAEFRWNFAPHVTTGETEVKWRTRHGHDLGTPLNVEYLGIWDTVGALGVPGFLGMAATLINAKYRFHDTKLSRSVLSGRHAISIDERRATFPPAPWENIDALNKTAQERGDGMAYLETWFPGDHGIIGGGVPDRGISNYALVWIAEGAGARGLNVDPLMLDAFRAHTNASGALTGKTGIDPLGIVSFARKGPTETDRLNIATYDRMEEAAGASRPGYMPEPLFPMRRKIYKKLGWSYRGIAPPRPRPPKARPPVVPPQWR